MIVKMVEVRFVWVWKGDPEFYGKDGGWQLWDGEEEVGE